MWRFTLFDFPVVVHWPFWLMAAMLGNGLSASGPEQMQMLIIWVAIVFVSILTHELGHALAMRHFGDRQVGIALYAFGGLAQGTAWRSRTEQIIISAAGPAFSAMLALLGWLFARGWPPESVLLAVAVRDWWWVNFGWTILNILPIIPLDGGRISEALFGPDRSRSAYTLSMVTAGIVALYMLPSLWNCAFFGMMAFNNWKQLQGQRGVDWMRP